MRLKGWRCELVVCHPHPLRTILGRFESLSIPLAEKWRGSDSDLRGGACDEEGPLSVLAYVVR